MSEEYLDLKALTKRIPFSRSAIEELIAGGELIEGIHFRRPTGPAGKEFSSGQESRHGLRARIIT
jgi:hypothetical protein